MNLALGLLANDPVRTDSHSTFIPTVLPQCKLANMLYWFSKVPCVSRMFLNVELKHTWERLAVAEVVAWLPRSEGSVLRKLCFG